MERQRQRCRQPGWRPARGGGILTLPIPNHPISQPDPATASQQEAWAVRPIAARLAILRRARNILAERSHELADAIPATLARTPADTRVAEILPLLAACKFLEREAARILAPRHLGRRGLPFWLAGVRSEVHRVPCGTILIIGPANYPLFLPGVQALQALAAGNAVVWKPGRGGQPVAELFANALTQAGLPEGLLRVTGDSVDASLTEIARHPAKIFFTGSSTAGRAVLHAAAETATPVVVELSGCDAVIVLPSADPGRVIAALAFGLRLNGSATCMAPRRLILVGPREVYEPFLTNLRNALAFVPPVPLPDTTRAQLNDLLRDAEAHGATVLGAENPLAPRVRPILILNGTPALRSTRTDIFAPILTVLHAPDANAALTVEQACPFGLTTAIFGKESEARALATRIDTGTVLLNDLIAPTADPRVPFTGRRASGFGATRGPEGLLAMTAPKSILIRRGNSRRHLQPTGEPHASLFDGLILASHAATWRQRLQGIRQIVASAKKLT